MTRCTVCLDARVQAIDARLAAGTSTRKVAAEFGLGPESVKRHARFHAARSAPPAAGGKPARASGDPLAQLVDALRPRALTGIDASTVREYRLALAALQERSSERPAYDVRTDPEWLRLVALMVDALRPFPEARQALADAIRQELG